MKKVSFLCAVCFFFIVMHAGALAQTSEARKTLEGCVNQVLHILGSPEFQNGATKDQAIDKIDALVRTIFDFEQFSARTVGPRWPGFSADQKTEFQEAFGALLRATYLDKLKDYSGERVLFTDETASKKGDKVAISTLIETKDKKNIPVIYKMLLQNGKWVVYDVVIEGLSLIQNYRSQFQDILATQTPEQLIGRVWAQARKLREATVKKQ